MIHLEHSPLGGSAAPYLSRRNHDAATKEFDMDILEALDVLEKLPTVPEIAKTCRKEITRLHRLVEEYKRSNIALESMRPIWAQGWTSDSQAAQDSAAALAQIWEFLGVDNQTAAMEALRARRADRT